MINLPPYPQNSTPDWGGMTLQEIQMRRTLLAARMEIKKFQMASQLKAMKSKAPVFGGPNSLFSRLSGAFTLAEYGLFAIKIFRLVSPMFRGRK